MSDFKKGPGIILIFVSPCKYVAIYHNCLCPIKLNSEKKRIIGLKVGLILFSIHFSYYQSKTDSGDCKLIDGANTGIMSYV